MVAPPKPNTQVSLGELPQTPRNSLHVPFDTLDHALPFHRRVTPAPPTASTSVSPVPKIAWRGPHTPLATLVHDASEGGLAVALAEMCIGGRLGCQIELDTDDVVSALYSESNARLLVEVRPEDCAAFEPYFATLPLKRIGAVTEEAVLHIANHSQTVLSTPVATLVTAWNQA